jgi:hypothetical protein
MFGPLQPLRDFDAEAKRIIEAAETQKVVLRLFGGISFLLRCPSARQGSLRRNYLDLDFMGYSKQSREIGHLLKGLGYVPREIFNAWQGYKRLIFNDIANKRRVDVFLDVFEMCHKFDMRKRLEIDRYTIPLADMLATKLQIREINEKDMKDILSLLTDYDIGETDSNLINGAYIAKLCGDDWGIYKTFTINLDAVLASLPERDLESEQKEVVRARTKRLKEVIELAPKSLKWNLRAKVGERARWYELPEPDQELVDSRISKENSNGAVKGDDRSDEG